MKIANKEDLMRVANPEDLIKVLNERETPFKELKFFGSRRLLRTDGISYSDGEYKTVCNGWGTNFVQSSKKRGETLEYEGGEWLVLWNSYSPGDECSFAGHSFVIVPVEALA